MTLPISTFTAVLSLGLCCAAGATLNNSHALHEDCLICVLEAIRTEVNHDGHDGLNKSEDRVSAPTKQLPRGHASPR